MMSNELMVKKIEELKGLKAMAYDLEMEIKYYEDEVKTDMLERGVEELRVGDYKVRYKTVKSTRLDSKALKAEMPDLVARYSTENEYKRLTIA